MSGRGDGVGDGNGGVKSRASSGVDNIGGGELWGEEDGVVWRVSRQVAGHQIFRLNRVFRREREGRELTSRRSCSCFDEYTCVAGTGEAPGGGLSVMPGEGDGRWGVEKYASMLASVWASLMMQAQTLTQASLVYREAGVLAYRKSSVSTGCTQRRIQNGASMPAKRECSC
jgi:hypothetical protein